MLNNNIQLQENEFLEAIRTDNRPRVQELLKTNPALAQIKTKEGFTPVFVALYRGNKQLASTIARSKGSLDVFEAACLGELEKLKQLVEKNPSLVKAYSPDGFTALALAAYLGQKDTVEYLISKGADVNAKANNTTGFTPLTGTVSENHTEIAKILAENGANVNHRYEGGYAPLIHAAASGNIELVKVLLDSKADPNVRANDGTTPLSAAKAKNHSEVVKLLQKHGAKQ